MNELKPGQQWPSPARLESHFGFKHERCDLTLRGVVRTARRLVQRCAVPFASDPTLFPPQKVYFVGGARAVLSSSVFTRCRVTNFGMPLTIHTLRYSAPHLANAPHAEVLRD